MAAGPQRHSRADAAMTADRVAVPPGSVQTSLAPADSARAGTVPQASASTNAATSRKSHVIARRPMPGT